MSETSARLHRTEILTSDVEGIPFGAYIAETNGGIIDSALKPLQNQLLSSQELHLLKDWLNSHPWSSLARKIWAGNLVCFGKPGSFHAPILYYKGGTFVCISYWVIGYWESNYRVTLHR